MMLSFEQLTGRSEKEIIFAPELNAQVHAEAQSDLLKLKQEAAQEGFDLRLASAFRSFERQLTIFNAKARGEKKILNQEGLEISANDLNNKEKLLAILRWSAFPGASRHHWGSDFDIYDQAAVSADYRLQLVPQEFSQGGPFEHFHDWLDERMKEKDFPFYRPYDRDRSGVHPERWHLSHKISQTYFTQYSFEIFKKNIEESQVELKNLIFQNAQEFFERFVRNVTLPPWP